MSKKKILWVEDEPDILAAVVPMLKREGWEVHTADSAEGGYFLADRIKPDLIIGLGGSLAPYMVTTTTLAKWFKRDLGKAMSTMSIGIGIGGAAIPLLVKLVDTLATGQDRAQVTAG